MSQHPRANAAWLPSFLLLAAIWGCSFAFIEVSLRALSAVQVAAGRLALGAAALLLITVVTRTPLPRSWRTWAHLAVVGALLNAVPFTLFAYGQQYISSVLAGIINAATPLSTLLVILAAFPEEKPTRDRVSGLGVGFVGVCIVLGVWRGFGGEWAGVLACLAAITCYGLAFPYSRRNLTGRGERPLQLATGQVLTATAMMLPPLLVTGTAPPGELSPSVIGAMLLLGVLGSGLAYILNFRIIAAAGASTASTVTYLTPIIAALVGVAVLGEHVSWNQPLGGLVVLTGVALAQGRLRRRAGATESPAAAVAARATRAAPDR